MAAYERALETLYQAPLGEFTSLRARLAAEMRAKGDRPSAGRLTACRRPTISAWTVNQLYWRARRDFDEMRAAAERLRAGDLDATPDYRRALATLRRRAGEVLKEAGHAASDAVLARVAKTLTAVAAAGFEPDAPGTLATDRDPPGFDFGIVPAKRRHDAGNRSAIAKQPRVDELAERRRQAERVRQARERQRLERELAAARAELERRERALSGLQAELRGVEQGVEQARTHLRDLERALSRLGGAP
jgi:hypothetical protein